MSNERIDIEAYAQIFEADDGITDEQLVAFGLSAISELKRMYEREDELMEILSILEDRHDIDMSQFDASE